MLHLDHSRQVAEVPVCAVTGLITCPHAGANDPAKRNILRAIPMKNQGK